MTIGLRGLNGTYLSQLLPRSLLNFTRKITMFSNLTETEKDLIEKRFAEEWDVVYT